MPNALLLVVLLPTCVPKPPLDDRPPVEEEDEDEEHLLEHDEPIDPMEPPPELYPEPREDSGRIRAASWNVRQFTPAKAASPAPGGRRGTMKDEVFGVLTAARVDIAALQEMYHSTGDPLAAAPAGWQVLSGLTTHTSTREHCAIVYDPGELNCAQGARFADWRSPAGDRGMNWALCTANADTPPQQEFWFGCAHFSYGSAQLGANIQDFYAALQAPKPANAGPTFGASRQDNFILGLDANSHPSDPKGATRRFATWRGGNAKLKPPLTFAPLSRSGPQFTKMRMQGANIRTSSTNPVLDDLIWLLQPAKPLTYVPGTKHVVDISAQWGGVPLATVYQLSDHLPVVADFDVAP